jgi:hypothetical protein
MVYLDIQDYRLRLAPVATNRPRPGQGVFGYGSKISTDLILQLRGERRWRRVYCCQWSNSGTCYAVVRGERRIVEVSHGEVEADSSW